MQKAFLTPASLLDLQRAGRKHSQPTSLSRQRAVLTCVVSAGLCLLAFAYAQPIFAQSTDAVAAAPESAASAPESVVRWSSSLPEAAGKTVELQFDLYQNSSGGVSLWSEIQTVKVSADGKYTVLLGVTTPEGLPATLFSGGEARWVEVKLSGANSGGNSGDNSAVSAGGKTPRSLLAAVPYAFKSVDAASLGGRAASDYVTREELQANNPTNSTNPAFTPMLSALTGTGTTNYIPVWTGAATEGNSTIYQSGANVGINTTTPQTTFDVNGTFTARSDMRLNNEQVATSSAPRSSPLGEFVSSSYSSTLAAAVPESFAWQAVGESNNTAAPTGILELLSGSGATYLSPTPTGFSLAANGEATFVKGQGYPLYPQNAATAATSYNSPSLQWESNAYSSSSSASVAQNFTLRAVASGNDTASPTGNLELFTGSGSAASNPTFTGLKIAPTGIITFASGQTFGGAGGGTITSVATTSPLTGGASSGAVTVGLNTSTLETTLNSVYAKLSGGNIFSSYLEAYQTAGSGNAALLGWGTNGSVGDFGDSDTGYGVQGESTSGYGTYSQVTTPGAGSAGVLGFTGTTFSTTYSGEAGVANAGIWADTSAAGSGVPVSLFATGDDVYAGAFITNGGDFPSLFADNNTGTAFEAMAATGYGVSASTSSGTGVYGSTSGGGSGVEGLSTSLGEQEAGVLGIGNTTSVVGSLYNIYSGVWGDTGTSSTTVAPAWAIGVLGTADDGHAGVFLNNSTGFSTMYVENYGSGGNGLFKTLMASTPTGSCGIGGNGDLSCTGQVKALVSAGNGTRKVETYSVQSPENWMEDFGSGQVNHGVAVVKIDPAYGETVTADSSYHVFLTPNGDSKGLYVINKTATSFEVRESSGGTSSLSFDYRIVAKRRGFEAQRLTDVTERFNSETKAATMARSSGTHIHAAMAKHKAVGLELAPKTPARKFVPGVLPKRAAPVSENVAATK